MASKPTKAYWSEKMSDVDKLDFVAHHYLQCEPVNDCVFCDMIAEMLNRWDYIFMSCLNG